MKKESQNLLESFKSNLKEDYVIAYYWKDNNGYIGREEDSYAMVNSKDEAIKYRTEEEAEHNKEDINQFFGGKAKLVVMKESCKSIKEDEEFYGGGVNEKVGGDYDDFIYELQNFRASMNIWYNECSTHLAQQIIEDTIMSFDDIIKRYEQQKDIEIIGAMDK